MAASVPTHAQGVTLLEERDGPQAWRRLATAQAATHATAEPRPRQSLLWLDQL
jgi:hypothetical protein